MNAPIVENLVIILENADLDWQKLLATNVEEQAMSRNSAELLSALIIAKISPIIIEISTKIGEIMLVIDRIIIDNST